jgi:hypothetical protein
LLAAAFEMKLESTLKTLGLLKSDLPDIAKSILQSAIECSEKNSTEDGPPSFLMTDLEGLFNTNMPSKVLTCQVGYFDY